MTILCVIPVRGGSKGVPGKNIRDLGGLPLVAWTIRSALAAEADLRVLVSTDSPEIREVALEHGAEVPFLRPSELAEDLTPSEPVIEHALSHHRAEAGEPEGVLFLQATSPLRFPGTLDRAVDQFRATRVDSLVGVVPVTPFLWRYDAEPSKEAPTGHPVADYDVYARLRRQDMSRIDLRYRENGSLYLTRPGIYDRLHNRIGGTVGLFELDDLEGTDIDTELDFTLAEQLVARHAKALGNDGAATTAAAAPSSADRPGGRR
ncbi:acylneuraminate cytidylyltransferase family protein [Kocuria soli]|uniref:Acylneuraminate cytidylyltransferase family protein n=1 Tax=Kocuria soli TaxID=2485125 RepID=A0A3N3ZSU1_9MICC|nr:acylneuraminate cytidylyltransferase family protein [Kocuria soli]ROZ63039.1 acylneuraminate cytidylyltransferase family protein [Kocuria soli]